MALIPYTFVTLKEEYIFYDDVDVETSFYDVVKWNFYSKLSISLHISTSFLEETGKKVWRKCKNFFSRVFNGLSYPPTTGENFLITSPNIHI
jgi:hypothetical protein